MSLGGRSYTTNALGGPSQITPLPLPAPEEHPLYSEWRIFDRWLQSEDERVAQDVGFTRPLSLGDTPAPTPHGDVETAAILYHLRRQVDDAIMIEENRSKRTTADKRLHLAPNDAMKQEVRGMPPAPQRTYTLDTDDSGNFSGFDQNQKSGSSVINRPDRSIPSPSASPSASSHIASPYFNSIDWAQSPTETMMPHDRGHTSLGSTTCSSFANSPDSRVSVSRCSVSTAGSTPEGATSRPLRQKLSISSLATIALGEGALEWNSLCRKVQVERQSAEHLRGRECVVIESKECDIHWRYREDTGISLRTLYRSSKDSKPRPWTIQHFAATGPSIPLTTTYPDGVVSVDFPRGSFGKLDKNWTDIKYTFTGYDSAEKFQTLLYSNNGADAAELKYDRPILSISSDRNPTECRGRNLRLWRRHETHLDDNGPVTFEVLVLLFYTSALGDDGHWVEEPHYAFEWLSDSIYKKDSERLTLVFSKDSAKWTPDKLFQRRRSSRNSINDVAAPRSPIFSRKLNDSMEIPELTHSGTDVNVAFSTDSIQSSRDILRSSLGSGSSRVARLNRFGYSELDIKFQNKKDRRAFLDVWKEYVKTL